MALRVAVSAGEISAETAHAIRDYVSPIRLFGSGAEAAAHGMREIRHPDSAARAAMDKITRTRADIIEG